jgi:DNA-binding transcriptional ArsR family regulator
MSAEKLFGGKVSAANVEVTSQQLLNELIEIKGRVGALENVAGIANQEILIKYFREVLNTPQRRQIMAACREPQKRDELVSKFRFNSPQALHHHLKPLREGLIHETHSDGVMLYEWSLLFKRLPQKKKESLLEEAKQTKN